MRIMIVMYLLLISKKLYLPMCEQCLLKIKVSDRTQKPFHPSINSDFTPFHEPKNRSPNISLLKLKKTNKKYLRNFGD